MTVLMDTPKRRPVLCRLGQECLTAHLISDLPGDAGTVELIGTGSSLGLHPDWLQERGTHREHHDLIGERIIGLARVGQIKEVTALTLGRIMRKKQIAEREKRQCQTT